MTEIEIPCNRFQCDNKLKVRSDSGQIEVQCNMCNTKFTWIPESLSIYWQIEHAELKKLNVELALLDSRSKSLLVFKHVYNSLRKVEDDKKAAEVIELLEKHGLKLDFVQLALYVDCISYIEKRLENGEIENPSEYLIQWKWSDEMARLFIKHGADVNYRGGYWASPLHYAMAWGSLEYVKILVEHGAEINAPEGPEPWKQRTPLDSASAMMQDTRALGMHAENESKYDYLRRHGGRSGRELRGKPESSKKVNPRNKKCPQCGCYLTEQEYVKTTGFILVSREEHFIVLACPRCNYSSGDVLRSWNDWS